MEVTSQGDDARVTIQSRGRWEQVAYQTDNRFIVEVKPMVEQPSQAVKPKPGYAGEKLSLNFQNVEVRAVLQVIADFTGLNIITSDTVSGNLTLRLKDVPWDQALDIILQAKGLDMREDRQRGVDRAARRDSPPRRSLPWKRSNRSRSWSRCAPRASSSTTRRPSRCRS